jgi:hypothetical protein
MKLQNPRGFSASSFVATVCDNVQAVHKKAVPCASGPLDICALYDLTPAPFLRTATPAPILRQLCAVDLATDARKIFLPTGKILTRKNGKTVEEKMMILLCSSIVTVTTASGGAFTLTTTNKGQNVKDSRTDVSRPQKEAEQILKSLCSSEDAAKAYAHLLAGIAEPKAKQSKPIREAVTAAESAAFAEFMKPRQVVRHPKAKEEKVDVTAMTPRQLAAYNRKQSKQAASDMAAYLTPLTLQ